MTTLANDASIARAALDEHADVFLHQLSNGADVKDLIPLFLRLTVAFGAYTREALQGRA